MVAPTERVQEYLPSLPSVGWLVCRRQELEWWGQGGGERLVGVSVLCLVTDLTGAKHSGQGEELQRFRLRKLGCCPC